MGLALSFCSIFAVATDGAVDVVVMSEGLNWIVARARGMWLRVEDRGTRMTPGKKQNRGVKSLE